MEQEGARPEKTLRWTATMALKTKSVLQAVDRHYNAQRGHGGSVLGHWRREGCGGKPFILVNLCLETQPSATWKSSKENINWVRSQIATLLPLGFRFRYQEPPGQREREFTQIRHFLCARHGAGHLHAQSFNPHDHSEDSYFKLHYSGNNLGKVKKLAQADRTRSFVHYTRMPQKIKRKR